MGLWKILTKQIGGTLRWSEPFLLASRLRNRLIHKLAAMAACPAVCVVGMLILEGTSDNRTLTPGIAVGIGLLVGCGLIFAVVLRAGDISGSVSVRKRDIYRMRVGGGIEMLGGMMLIEMTTWPYEAIRECRIIHPSSSGHWFSVLEVHSGGSVERIGVPRRVDVKLLARRLQAAGVPVSYEGAVALEGLKTPAGVWLVPVVVLAVVIGVVCLGYQLMARDKQNRKQADAGPAPVARDVPPAIDPEDRPPRGISGVTPPRPAPPKRQGEGRTGSEPGSVERPPGLPGERSEGAPPGLPTGPGGRFGPRFGPGRRMPGDVRAAPWEGRRGGGGVRAGQRQGGMAGPSPSSAGGPGTKPSSLPGARGGPAGEAVATVDSELVGGAEGRLLRHTDPSGRAVIGVRYRERERRGEQVMQRLEPLFEKPRASTFWEAVVAREGYALGAIQVDADTEVRAVRLAFMRIDGDRLDPKDVYTTEWIGTRTGGQPKTLNAKGARILGLVERRRMSVQALGLILEKSP